MVVPAHLVNEQRQNRTATIVVEYTEVAQSYIAQPNTVRRSLLIMTRQT